MTPPAAGGIDCDIHPAVPSLQALLPYLDEHWREQVVTRGLDELASIAYPNNSPLTARPDWRPPSGRPGADLARLRAEALDPFGTSIAIANCLYGVQLLYSEDMAAAFARAVNDWMAKEWLDREPRLRASIVVPVQNPELAVDEIERCARDPRFVQVLLLVMGDSPLGKRRYWPIYAAAERHGLPIGIHAGSAYHTPPTPVGWPSYYTEDYVAQAQAFQTQLTSLICEGVFTRYPNLKVVLLESGFTWLPAHLWRLTKYWRGLRMEIPWVDRAPTDIVRSNVRLSLQPVDAPPDRDGLLRIIDHMQSDELLLFSTDYPHWQFDGDAALPEGLPDSLVRKMMLDNPRATYRRLPQPAGLGAPG
ncbi:amidohydrolase family protein [Limobrevibacterium gyesilva]|uniref:Amidohydrolase family protein n=1 Tax=Limobrevibacterium gyesilva TaxID=2991712 RepID=A0AA42CGZ9_9PROT|nr:amidohydrolase family protein [Limobrevibacterium gyesilva]MCW3476671.1 amidohydrolase family protein [Limobrevibacterium gyesilva]